jgi:hypothetical protein
MKARHWLSLGIAVVAAVLALNGCQLLGFVSISDRIADLQSSLNNADRSSGFDNFHPTACSDYNALKSTTYSLWATTFPTSGITYALSITDQSNASAVMVTATGGGSFGTLYLQLSFQTTGLGDNRIVTMATSATPGGTFTTIIQ